MSKIWILTYDEADQAQLVPISFGLIIFSFVMDIYHLMPTGIEDILIEVFSSNRIFKLFIIAIR